jgi:4-amino-4-deoxy-L-arabinose transferase-like glycosyltransferase
MKSILYFLLVLLLIYFLNAFIYLSVDLFFIGVFLALMLLYFSDNLLKFSKADRWDIFLLSFLLILLWGLYVKTTPFSDFKTFYNQSINFCKSPSLNILQGTKSPATIIYYAFFVELFGENILSFYIASSFIWAIGGLIFSLVILNFGFSESVSRKVQFLYSLYPGIIFYGTVVSSESVFMFLLISSFYVFSKLLKSENDLLYTLILGFSLSFLFLSRGIGIVFIISFLLSFFMFFNKKGAYKRITLLIIGISIPLLFQVYLNYKYANSISFSASKWSSYNFMVGTNKKYNGGYNVEDSELAGFYKLSHAEASKIAFNIAVERIASDFFGFIKFALTDKIKRLWGTDVQNVYWGIGKSPKKTLLKDEINFAKKLNSNIYSSIFVLFLFSLILSIIKLHVLAKHHMLYFIMIMPMLLIAFLHLFIEVQPRYHLPFLPFMIVGAVFSFEYLLKKLGKLKDLRQNRPDKLN